MLRRFSVSDDFADFYKENGYVIFTDLLSRDELEQVRSDIFSLFEIYFNSAGEENLSGGALMAAYYEKDKDAWRRCAKRMYDLLSVYGMAVRPKVAEALKKMGLQTPMISSRPEVRTDMPRDEQYTQPWHQDWRYGQGSVNSATIWVPLHKVTVDNGTVEVSPGSHLLGYLENEELSNPRRFVITDPRLKDLPSAPVELEFGEAVAFSQMTVHRSGYNRTDAPRVSVQMRFSDYSDSLFLANGLPAPLSSSELLWKQPPSAEDMRQSFGAH
jgi:phytanoyl-CoA hydroxylase